MTMTRTMGMCGWEWPKLEHLHELALSKLPLGHPTISRSLSQQNRLNDYRTIDWPGVDWSIEILETLPNLPSLIGDCAELLEDRTSPGLSSKSMRTFDLMAALKASLAAASKDLG